MENKVLFRELKDSDIPALEDVVRKTWDYDKFATPKAAKRLAEAYLSTCLSDQTYTRVAEVNGIPAGLIFGKNTEKHHCPFKYRCRQIVSTGRLLAFKEGREILGFYKDINNIYDQLFKRCGKKYKGVITLFALLPEYRGLGIGKKLFNALRSYMASESIKEFYLYTDTSCNFGFYEHQGMVRRQQQTKSINMKGQKGDLEIFLYDMTV